MSDQPWPNLPNESSWGFNDIACFEPDRAHALEMAGTPEALIEALNDALDHALDSTELRIGREHAENNWDDCRAIVQFAVGAPLFDWFLNARTGYRAHFRAGYERGLRFNSQIIQALRNILVARLPDVVAGRDLDSGFSDRGAVRIPKCFLMASLAPDLSKVWFCTKRIELNGEIKLLPTGVVGPKVLLGFDDAWPAPYRKDDSAWLDVKGAFLGNECSYQVKEPISRAKRLHAKGEA